VMFLKVSRSNRLIGFSSLCFLSSILRRETVIICNADRISAVRTATGMESGEAR
jgi:hypothetical protein